MHLHTQLIYEAILAQHLLTVFIRIIDFSSYSISQKLHTFLLYNQRQFHWESQTKKLLLKV